MDLRDILYGIAILFIGNLSMYFIYPLFVSFINQVSNTGLGDMALSESLQGISYVGFLGAWAIVGAAVPIYFIIKGAGRD